METSILVSTKKILGLSEDYDAFDLDIITHINSVLAILNQMGIIEPYFEISDDTGKWSDLKLPSNQTNMVRTYIFLKVRMLFDPPTMSYVLDAMNKQIEEFETRLEYFRDNQIPVPTQPRFRR